MREGYFQGSGSGSGWVNAAVVIIYMGRFETDGRFEIWDSNNPNYSRVYCTLALTLSWRPKQLRVRSSSRTCSVRNTSAMMSAGERRVCTPSVQCRSATTRCATRDRPRYGPFQSPSQRSAAAAQHKKGTEGGSGRDTIVGKLRYARLHVLPNLFRRSTGRIYIVVLFRL